MRPGTIVALGGVEEPAVGEDPSDEVFGVISDQLLT